MKSVCDVALFEYTVPWSLRATGDQAPCRVSQYADNAAAEGATPEVRWGQAWAELAAFAWP